MNSFAVFMYFNLQKQAYEWMAGLGKMRNKYMQNKMDEAYKANQKLIDGIERELGSFGEEYNEQFWKDSEYFSEVLSIIRKAESEKKKQELIYIMRDYIDGRVTVIHDNNQLVTKEENTICS